MSELAPVFGFMFILIGVSAIPNAVISWIWGGRAVLFISAAIGIALVGYLIWLAFTMVPSTGMEGLAFIILPIYFLGVCIGAGVGHGLTLAIKSRRASKI